MEFSHEPVLLQECIEGLAIRPDGVYLDGTAGGGGHSFEIAKRLTSGRLIALDRDEEAVRAASARLAPLGERATVLRCNFSTMAEATRRIGVHEVDGILLDIGVSSYQLDNPARGFSYNHDAPLDMRMAQDQPLTAYQIVNGYSEQALADLIFTYGEERWAKRIAAFIVQARQTAPIETTFQLNAVIKQAVPAGARRDGPHPSKRTFQAIRIAVNDELGELRRAVEEGISLLRPGGRFCIITFHSLEDRIVKQAFAQAAKGCTCPPQLPVCVCGNKPQIRLVTRKPVVASEEELARNPRSRSAKLRVAEKLPQE